MWSHKKKRSYNVPFAPIKMVPGARRALDKLYRDFTGEWPEAREAKL